MQQPMNLLYVWVPFSTGHPVQYSSAVENSTIRMLIPTTGGIPTYNYPVPYLDYDPLVNDSDQLQGLSQYLCGLLLWLS